MLDWHGKSSGIAKEHGNAWVFALHSFRALCLKTNGKKRQMEGHPLTPHRELERALGHMRESPADPITDVSARSPWLRL